MKDVSTAMQEGLDGAAKATDAKLVIISESVASLATNTTATTRTSLLLRPPGMASCPRR